MASIRRKYRTAYLVETIINEILAEQYSDKTWTIIVETYQKNDSNGFIFSRIDGAVSAIVLETVRIDDIQIHLVEGKVKSWSEPDHIRHFSVHENYEMAYFVINAVLADNLFEAKKGTGGHTV